MLIKKILPLTEWHYSKRGLIKLILAPIKTCWLMQTPIKSIEIRLGSAAECSPIKLNQSSRLGLDFHSLSKSLLVFSCLRKSNSLLVFSEQIHIFSLPLPEKSSISVFQLPAVGRRRWSSSSRRMAVGRANWWETTHLLTRMICWSYQKRWEYWIWLVVLKPYI